MVNLRQQLDDHCEHVYRLNMIACGHRLFPCLFCQILFLNVGNAHTYFVIKYPKYHCPPLSEKIRKRLGEKTQQNYIYICTVSKDALEGNTQRVSACQNPCFLFRSGDP